jgi:hypothetical protein
MGTQSWRATKVAFGSAATSPPNSSYLGVYTILSLSAKTASFTTYALTGSSTDPVVDTFTISH